MLLIAAAALQLARQWAAGSKRRWEGHSDRGSALSDSDAEALSAAVGPVLLAAETAAGVDETAALTAEQLRTLNAQLRMLIASMDGQLMELQALLEARLPDEAAAELRCVCEQLEAAERQLEQVEQWDEDTEQLVQTAHDLRWACFAVLQPHAPEADRRTYRSLLFNSATQRALLLQVERQEALRRQMESLERRMVEVEGSLAAGEAAAAGQPGSSERQHEPAAAATTSATVVAPPATAAEAGCSPGSGRELRLVSSGCSLAHTGKRETGGEDAFFVSEAGLGAVGVADGVGGWARSGIDPKVYPQQLMEACSRSVQRHDDPLRALLEAHDVAHAPGSCTLALATLRAGGALRVASLGDCGARLLRGGSTVFASEVQEHRFNQPFQISSPRFMPSSVPADMRRYSLRVQAGDVILLGSDGLFDNLWEEDIAARVGARMQALSADRSTGEVAAAAAELASELAAAAHAHSCDPTYRSPFAVERHERGVAGLAGLLLGPMGGKQDDVTVVVSIVW